MGSCLASNSPSHCCQQDEQGKIQSEETCDELSSYSLLEHISRKSAIAVERNTRRERERGDVGTVKLPWTKIRCGCSDFLRGAST